MADAAMQKVKDLDSTMNSQLNQFGEEFTEERHISLCGGIKRRAGWLDRWRLQDIEKKAKLAKLTGTGRDLSKVTIMLVIGADAKVNARMRLYAKLLQDEVWESARVRWEVAENAAAPSDGTMALRLLIDDTLSRQATGSGAPHEAYRIDASPKQIAITGASQRGLLFGAGRLLRELV
jgi:hypothetical protein